MNAAETKDREMLLAQYKLLGALQNWRIAKSGSAGERKAARMLAYRASELLRSAGIQDGAA
jgi:hypothetical protein